MVYGTPGQVTYIMESMAAVALSSTMTMTAGWTCFFLGGRTLDGTPPGSGNRSYHNNRDGSFTDVTAKAGLADPGWAVGVCIGDYDNDGFEDLFLTYYGHNRFTTITATAHLYRCDIEGRAAAYRQPVGPDALSWTTTATAT